MGQSPQHGRNVSLVLDMTTRFVKSNFHVKHDEQFETIKQIKMNSKWQSKVGFVEYNANNSKF